MRWIPEYNLGTQTLGQVRHTDTARIAGARKMEYALSISGHELLAHACYQFRSLACASQIAVTKIHILQEYMKNQMRLDTDQKECITTCQMTKHIEFLAMATKQSLKNAHK
jgi:hypothetical protein